MNKLTKIFAGVVLAGSAAMASASPVFLDVIADGDADGDNVTDAFTSFVFNSFTPESAYLDLEGDGIQAGTMVFDTGSATITGLSPLAFGDSLEGFNGATFGLTIDYELFGYAGLAVDANSNGFFDAGDDSLAAQFVDGYLTMTMSDSSGLTEILYLDINSSAYNINNGLNFTIFGEPTSATNTINTTQSFNGLTGLSDLIASLDPVNLSSFATIKILDATEAPTLEAPYATSAFQDSILSSLGLSTLPATAQWLTRETTLDSSNLYITVSAPTNIALMGLGLIGLGFSRRLAKK